MPDGKDDILKAAEDLIAKIKDDDGPPDILIVDDVRANVFLIESILSDRYRVRSVNSAEGMWKLLRRMKPRLILLDLMMPFENGFVCLEKLSESPEWRDIPVIVVTAKDTRADVMNAMRLGARDYIVKPVDDEVLLGKIGKILKPER